MKKAIELVMNFLAWIVGLSFLLLFVLTILSIALRYVLGVAWLWVPDFSRLLFIWIIFTGATVMYARNGHLVMDYFVNRMKANNRDLLDCVIHIAMAAFLLVLVVKGIDVTKIRMRIPFDAWEIPTGYAYLALPVNAFFMLLSDTEYIAARLFSRRVTDEQ